jgi:hypothetical protein
MNKTIVILLMLLATTAQAHHSSAMFDAAKVVEVEAKVTEFQWTNPHIWIEIMVVNADGEEEQWSIEGRGPNSLFREGWRPTTFKPGETISIRFHPMRDGTHAGGFIGAQFADGSTIGSWD